MNIIIIGAGAIGTYLAAAISREYDVILVGKKEHHHKDHFKVIQKQGILLSGFQTFMSEVLTTRELKEIPENSLILVATKAYDVKTVFEDLKNIVKEDTVFMLIQNGIGVKEEVRDILPNEIIRSVTGIGAEIIRPGEVRTSWGKVVLENTQSAQKVYEIFSNSQFATRISDNIISEEWLKLSINAFVNPLTTLLQVRTNMLSTPELRILVGKVIDEVIAVAEKEGIAVEREKVIRTIDRLSKYHNFSSMYQDVKKGKKTELDYITGAIIQRAKKHSIPVPMNEFLYDSIHFLEKYGY